MKTTFEDLFCVGQFFLSLIFVVFSFLLVIFFLLFFVYYWGGTGGARLRV